MVNVSARLNQVAWLLVLFGLLLASGSYRGHEADFSYPVVGGGMLVGALVIFVVAYLYERNSSPEDGAG